MFRRILVVLDNRAASQTALWQGTRLAASLGAEVVYLALTPAYAVTMADVAGKEDLRQEDYARSSNAKADSLLGKAMALAEQFGVMAHRMCSRTGADARSVLDIAARRRCDLVVAPTGENNAVVRLLSGDLIPGLITSSPVPLLVCKEAGLAAGSDDAGEPEAFRRILVVIEDASRAPTAVALATEFAQACGAELVFAPIPSDPGAVVIDAGGMLHMPDQHEPLAARERIEKLTATAMQQAAHAQVAAQRLPALLSGEAQLVADTAAERGCDLIIAATEQGNAVARLLTGSLIPGLITAARIPVMICREADELRNRNGRHRQEHTPRAPDSSTPSLQRLGRG